MSFLALIHKGGLAKVATATPATDATLPPFSTQNHPTVASVASVAVANSCEDAHGSDNVGVSPHLLMTGDIVAWRDVDGRIGVGVVDTPLTETGYLVVAEGGDITNLVAVHKTLIVQ